MRNELRSQLWNFILAVRGTYTFLESWVTIVSAKSFLLGRSYIWGLVKSRCLTFTFTLCLEEIAWSRCWQTGRWPWTWDPGIWVQSRKQGDLVKNLKERIRPSVCFVSITILWVRVISCSWLRGKLKKREREARLHLSCLGNMVLLNLKQWLA